jgi:predicted ATPase
MFKSIEIDNFRLFKHLSLNKLKRFNLITGRNASGKTTLLEAIFLNAGGGNPELVFAINNFRGDEVLHAETDRAIATCFFELDPANVVRIACQEERTAKARTRALTMNAQVTTETRIGQSRPEKALSGLRMRFSGAHGTVEASATLDVAAFAMSPTPAATPKSPLKFERGELRDLLYAQFLSPYLRAMYQDVYRQLSQLLKSKGLVQVLGILEAVGYKVLNIVPIVEAATQPMIYVDVGQPKLIPVSVMGAGFIHVLKLALALSEVDRGILLIDELEDGLHYSTFERVINALLESVEQKRDLQVFVATHSAELIDAAISATRQRKFDDFCLINLVPSKEGPKPNYYDKREIAYAKDLEAELR